MRGKRAPLAKLTRPKLVAVFPRERLFHLLDEGLAHRAVWITGPPGAGKTTLLSGYVETRRRPALWYQLDGGDDGFVQMHACRPHGPVAVFLDAVRTSGRNRLEVCAGAEGAPAARQDRDTLRFIVFKGSKRRCELVCRYPVHRVAGFGPIDRDHGDLVATLDENGILRHR